MNNLALITGASNGIGKELAIEHAKTGGDLVLVARSEAKLQAIKKSIEHEFSVKVEIIIKDLSTSRSAKELFEYTQSQNWKISMLINNAGFGEFGRFQDTKLEKETEMIHLNITTLTELTKFYLLPMLKEGKGKIMNVASTAAFLPGPLMSVYFATKAYVLHFTEAVNNEVKDQGVTLTALCPGATESGFIEAANLGESKLVKGRKLPSSKEVAVYGYKAMTKGKQVAIHGTFNYILANIIRLFPRAFVVKMTRMVQDKSA